MTSTSLTLSGTAQAIGSGQVLQAIISVDEYGYGELGIVGTSEVVRILGFEKYKLTGPNGRAFDASQWTLKGFGPASIFLQPAPASVAAPAAATYSSKTSFNQFLDSVFNNLFIAGGYQYTLKSGGSPVTIRANIEDQQILVGDGVTQSQGIQRTGMFIIDDLPDGWGVGDTVVYAGITYKCVEVMEQDEYTVTMALNRQAK